MYLLSAALHTMRNVSWLSNYGLSSDYVEGAEPVISRGAALYCGLLGMNVTIHDALMIHNRAQESSAIMLRPSIFMGRLVVDNTRIEDNASPTMLYLRHVPEWSITFLDCVLIGVVEVTRGTVTSELLRLHGLFRC